MTARKILHAGAAIAGAGAVGSSSILLASQVVRSRDAAGIAGTVLVLAIGLVLVTGAVRALRAHAPMKPGYVYAVAILALLHSALIVFR